MSEHEGAGAEENTDSEQFDPERVRDALEALNARTPGARQAATRRVGQTTRVLIERLMATSAPEDVLVEMADTLDGLVRRLDGYKHGRLYEGYAESAVAGRPSAFFDWSPLLGLANPLAPPIEMHVEGDGVVGHATFTAAYEGPPGCVHGGYLAAAFDEVLGMAQMIGGQPGMTGTLEVRYRQPTPLYGRLLFAARTVERRQRTITVEGDCRHDGVVTAEARAIFVQMSAERFGQLLTERERRRRRGDAPPRSDG